jgi:hypothetical protein
MRLCVERTEGSVTSATTSLPLSMLIIIPSAVYRLGHLPSGLVVTYNTLYISCLCLVATLFRSSRRVRRAVWVGRDSVMISSSLSFHQPLSVFIVSSTVDASNIVESKI